MMFHFFNLIISSVSFIGVYFYKTGHIYPLGFYGNLLPIFVLSFISISAYFKPDHLFFKERTKAGLLTFIFTLFTISLIISLSDFNSVSRQFLIIVIASSVFLQWLVGFIWQKKQTTKTVTESVHNNGFQFKRLGVSFFILTMSLLFMIYIKTGKITHYNWVEQISLLLIGLWWVTGVITKKFYAKKSLNIYYKIAPFLKSHIFFLLFAASGYYFLNLFYISRELFFGTIGIFIVVETSVYLFLFIKNKPRFVQFTHGQQQTGQNLLPERVNKEDRSHSIKSVLETMSPFVDERIINFIEEIVIHNNFSINKDSSLFLSTTTPSNFHFIGDESRCIIINLAYVNDLISINDMLLTMRSKILPGGILVGSFSPMEENYYRLRDEMPKFLFTLMYPIHFIIYRFFPKIPVFRTLYEFFTQGRGRVLSKAEVYGRLSYCGFKVIDTLTINHIQYFVAQLTKTKSKEKYPSLGPIVRLKRIGLHNEIISIYKFRTMHPYSEFIQEEVYKKNSLDESGKLKDDFRKTNWGKVLRKLWLDELPQIINWIQGDVTLVGVRALSEHYFSLYPKDLQELRVKFKPGIIPPYYADMPNNFEEILESERIYLLKKKEKPFSTDFKYFWKAFNNIVFHGARSQ